MNRIALPLILLLVLATHILMSEPTEPFYNGDETRHVMTGIFVADAIVDGGLWHPKSYAERYYAQYPALGLIVWPPGFYAVEGVTMLAFGRTFETGRWLTVGYCLLACVFVFRLVKLTHDKVTAMVATLVFAFSREVFFHSRNVMLEVPTTAFVLMAMYYLERYLTPAPLSPMGRGVGGEGRARQRWNLFLTGLACVLAGLHRYDAVLLVLYVLLRIAFARRWRLLLRRDVILTGLGVIVLLAPFYALAAVEIGRVQQSAATVGTDVASTHASRFDQYTLFFATLWAQVGHAAFGLGVLGLLFSFAKASGARNAPYWSIALATYLFFAPMAEQESRHAIYWIVSWAVWAADAALTLAGLSTRRIVSIVLALLLIIATAYWTLKQPVPWLRGYSAAADYAVQTVDGPAIILFDGHFSGTIVYELRTGDTQRRLWLARADKLFYASLSDPRHGTVEWTTTEEQTRQKLRELAPDLVIVEEPRARTDTPQAKRFRELISRHDGYERVAEFPIANNNLEWADGVRLIVYRSKMPRPPGPRTINIPMLWQGRTIEATIGK